MSAEPTMLTLFKERCWHISKHTVQYSTVQYSTSTDVQLVCRAEEIIGHETRSPRMSTIHSLSRMT